MSESEPAQGGERLRGRGSARTSPNDPAARRPNYPGFAPSTTVTCLSLAAGSLALVAAVVGLVWRGGAGGAVPVRTIHGQIVELYGRGLYRNDTLFVAGNNFGSDLVTVLAVVPLLAISLLLARRGSLRGRLLLLGALGCVLYIGASYALGAVAFNRLFLVYVGLFSASLFAFVGAFASLDLDAVAASLSPRMPRRWPGVFMFASGVVTLAIWVMEPLTALITGEAPKVLETHTTLFTHAVDMGVIVPAALVSGILILRGRTLGYVTAFSLLVLEALLMPMIAIATLEQIRLGISFTRGEVVGPIAGFSVFALLAVAVLISLLRGVEHAPSPNPGE